jgi:hypothetical protein
MSRAQYDVNKTVRCPNPKCKVGKWTGTWDKRDTQRKCPHCGYEYVRKS